MTKPKTSAKKTWLDPLINPAILFYLLPYMMVLLVAGTVAQKYVGLFTATKLFFSSFILWIGWLPLPGGAAALAILFVNLTAYFIVKSQWKMPALGSTVTHLGVIVLLLGGLVTLVNKQEGFIILRHGQQADAFYDYDTRYFSVEKNGKMIHQISFDQLKENQSILLPDGESVNIRHAYPNSMITENGTLKQIDTRLEEETNQAGLVFDVTVDNKKFSFLTTEFLQNQPHLTTKAGRHQFSLHRLSRNLPFGLRMSALRQDRYPGTEMAKSYETQFDVIEKDHEWPAHTAMNDPLRYQGYTFYQASVLTLPNGEQASVLNAVKDIGWLFPYAATALISIGLLLNAWARRHAKK